MLTLAELENWRASLLGDLVMPGHERYERATRVDNGRIQQFPCFVVFPRSVEDVVFTVRAAKAAGVALHAKAGGHSYAGYSLHNGGVLLDLSAMKLISFDHKETITVEMGALWSDVYRFLQNAGTDKIPVGGACTAVGVAGFVLGGGYSFVSRSYGLACDSLVSATIVTADGAVRQVSADSTSGDERDLFWACQGGGGGNFGVVVQMQLRVHRPRSEKLFAGTLIYRLEDAVDLLAFYNEWSQSLPDEMAVYGYLGHIPDPSSPERLIGILRFQPVYNGEFTAGLEMIRPLLERRPLATELYNLSLPDYLKIVGATTAFAGRSSYTRSGIMEHGGFSPDFTRLCLAGLQAAPSRESFMLWMHQGGKAKTVLSNATAYPHRHADYVFELAAVWTGGQSTRANVEWAFQAGQVLSTHFSGAYVNYIDPLQPDWASQYYGSNYTRLLEIKRRSDPDDFFAFQQGIGSAHAPGPSTPLCLDPLFRTK